MEREEFLKTVRIVEDRLGTELGSPYGGLYTALCTALSIGMHRKQWDEKSRLEARDVLEGFTPWSIIFRRLLKRDVYFWWPCTKEYVPKRKQVLEKFTKHVLKHGLYKGWRTL